jgi:DNA-binding transcriptional LysR family regulator
MTTSPGRGGLLPAIRSRFTAAHPEIRLKLRQVGWEDPTAGLANRTSDVAFVWLPLADAERYRWVVVATEPRLVALPETHPLAGRERVDFADLLDEAFLALPAVAPELRDHWLALDARDGRPPVIGGEIASADEAYEALVDGLGICLVAAGNVPLLARGGVVVVPVDGVSPTRFALAWRADDTRPLVQDYARAAVPRPLP